MLPGLQAILILRLYSWLKMYLAYRASFLPGLENVSKIPTFSVWCVQVVAGLLEKQVSTTRMHQKFE